MPIDVERCTLPAFTAATVRETIPTYDDEPGLWERLMPALAACGATLAPQPPCGAVFHDPDYREADVDVEIFQPVTEPVDLPAPMGCRDFPAVDVVAATLRGSYEGIDSAMAAIGEYLTSHGLQVAGPMVNHYRVGPGQSDDPQEWVTLVCVPVAAA